jgi:hypothetical protein
MFIVTIADIYYMNFIEVYETGSMIDILWDLSYILLAFGFLYHRETVKEAFSAMKKKKIAKIPSSKNLKNSGTSGKPEKSKK